jgi:hypothetical protein
MNLNDDPRGRGRPELTYQRLLDTDTHPVPVVLRRESALKSAPSQIPVERYTSR